MAGYRNPALTVDGVVFEKNETGDTKILLIRRKNEPFKGCWALPGGFVDYGEMVEDAVIRELHEETNLTCSITKMLGVYSDPKRDPRGHTVSVVYLMKKTGGALAGGDDAAEARFFDVRELPTLAFDHAQIIKDALDKTLEEKN